MNNLIKKGVAVAVILLFIGLAFAPVVTAKLSKESVNQGSVVNRKCFVVADVNNPYVEFPGFLMIYKTFGYITLDLFGLFIEFFWYSGFYRIYELLGKIWDRYYDSWDKLENLLQNRFMIIFSNVEGDNNSTFTSKGDFGWVNGTSTGDNFRMVGFTGFRIDDNRTDNGARFVGFCLELFA